MYISSCIDLRIYVEFYCAERSLRRRCSQTVSRNNNANYSVNPIQNAANRLDIERQVTDLPRPYSRGLYLSEREKPTRSCQSLYFWERRKRTEFFHSWVRLWLAANKHRHYTPAVCWQGASWNSLGLFLSRIGFMQVAVRISNGVVVQITTRTLSGD